jgi:hypothetical protein
LIEKASFLRSSVALGLEWSRRADGGVEGDVGQVVTRRASHDVASVLAFGLGERATARLLAGEFIERRIELARLEGFAGLYLLSAVPPVGIRACEHFLLFHRFGVALLRTFLRLLIFEF